MEILTFPLGPLETNCYLAVNGSSAAAVDVGGEPAPVLAYLQNAGLTLETILITHLHCDHIYGAKALHGATGAPIFAGENDGYLLDTELGRGGFMGLPCVDAFDYEHIGPGERSVIGRTCQVLPTPGHTRGSLSFYFPEDKAVFVGDLLFFRSIGRTDFPGGDYDALIEAVKSRIFALPEDTAVYSGHGPATSVGAEKKHNPYFSEFRG